MEPKSSKPEDKYAEQDTLFKDLVGGVLVLIVALGLFVPAVSDIYIDPRDPGFSSRDFPVGVLFLLVLLCAVMLLRPIYNRLQHRDRWHWHYAAETKALFRHVIPIMAVGFCYAWLVDMFQYFLPTFLVTVFATAIYGNRGVWRLFMVPLLVSAFFYLLFFGLLGLYEEPGSVLEYNNQIVFSPLRVALGSLFKW